MGAAPVSWFQAADDRFGAVGITTPGKSGMMQNHPTEPVPGPTGKVSQSKSKGSPPVALPPAHAGNPGAGIAMLETRLKRQKIALSPQ